TVAPLITAPSVITSCYAPSSANFLTASGISNAPGTHITVIFSSVTPCRLNVSVAPSNNLLVINSLKRATTIPTFSSVPTAFPSITFMLVQLLLFLISVPFFLVLFVCNLYFLSFSLHLISLVSLSYCHAFDNNLFFVCFISLFYVLLLIILYFFVFVYILLII